MGFIAIHSPPRIYSYSLFQSQPKKQKPSGINQLAWGPYESGQLQQKEGHGPNQRRDRVFVYSVIDSISN